MICFCFTWTIVIPLFRFTEIKSGKIFVTWKENPQLIVINCFQWTWRKKNCWILFNFKFTKFNQSKFRFLCNHHKVLVTIIYPLQATHLIIIYSNLKNKLYIIFKSFSNQIIWCKKFHLNLCNIWSQVLR